jgi:DNA-binding NarL/FixJ family response regulator
MKPKITKQPTHIFIVENDRFYINMLDYIFSKDFSYRFVNYKTGEECLDNMALNPDIVVLDYNLPGINGYDTLVEIKKNHPHVYVLVLLSDKDDKLPSQLFEAGADDYVLKENLKEDEITDKIEAFLNRESFNKAISGGGKRSSFSKVYYVLLALLALSAGVYYYQ